MKSRTKKAIFLDRDGVINAMVYHEDHGILDSPFTVDQFRLLPDIADAIKRFKEAGYLTILVSNQPAVAKGNLSLDMFNRIQAKMEKDLAAHDAYLDGQYYCMHHPQAVLAEYRLECECRKPKPGLILQAADDYGIDLACSWMIGDGVTDVKAGNEAGVQTVLFARMKCELYRLLDKYEAKPDIISSDILAITDEIIRQKTLAEMIQ